MNRLLRIKFFGLIIIVAVSLGVYLLGMRLELFANIENRSWDWRAMLIASSRKADDRIKLITIDQASLDYYAREEGITWPWPRSLYIPIIKFLELGGARGAAFDLIFTESSAHGVADDREYANALKSTIPVVSSVVLGERPSEIPDDGTDEFVARQRVSEREAPFARPLLSHAEQGKYQSITLPYPEIVSNTAAFGAVNSLADPDGLFRHILPGGFYKDVPVLTLPFSLFHVTGADTISSSLRLKKDPVVRLRGPSGSYPEENIVNIISSYAAITEGKKPLVSPDRYKDAFVFIGVFAPGLLDLRPTSLDKVFRGVEINAATLDNLLHNDFIYKTPHEWGLAFTFIFSVLLGAGIIFTGSSRTHFLVVATAALYFFYAEYLFALNGHWLPLAVPFLSLLMVVMTSLGFQYQLEGKEHRFIRGAFGRYVSPKVIEKIVSNPSSLALGGDRRELTIFFSDIAGFTSISERMEPTMLVSFLNFYLSEMTDIILGSGGTLDKYEGDAIIAFWNAPLVVEDHALRAAAAAKRCLERLNELDSHFQERFGARPTTRIGMHTGTVTVGNFGSTVRFDYTMIGDAANLASRLEGANKFFGTNLILSQQTLLKCHNEVRARYVGSVQVKGKSEVIKVFEPILSTHRLNDEALMCFEKGISAFERLDLSEAEAQLRRIESDPVAQKYLERIANMRKEPSEEQSYIWRFDEK